jgi:hypothetical protein
MPAAKANKASSCDNTKGKVSSGTVRNQSVDKQMSSVSNYLRQTQRYGSRLPVCFVVGAVARHAVLAGAAQPGKVGGIFAVN